MRVHLLANIHRKDALQAASDIATWLKARGVVVCGEHETALRTDLERVDDWTFGDCDLVVVFGGDGSLIRAAHLCSEQGTPILGVYFGRFGFVTQCNPSEIKPALLEFMEGNHRAEQRMMLEVQLIRNDKEVAILHALNETVLSREVTSRMMRIEVLVNDCLITQYPADGVLVCTPTGSTAYNLSVGGPILDPILNAIVVSAVAPHTLSARPLILDAGCTVDLVVKAGGDSVLSADGQSRLHLLTNDRVRITKSARVTNLLCVEKDDFLVKLNERLLWSHGLTKDDE